MNTSSKVWESKHLIRFPDCDPFNHLNNARYLDYFMNAREDHIMMNMNINIYEYARQYGLGWVVGKNEIIYLKPAFLMETVVIDSTLLQLNDTNVLVEMKMWNERKDKLKSILWSQFVHINMKTLKPEKHSDELIQAFTVFHNPLASPMTFDERVEELRTKVAA